MAEPIKVTLQKEVEAHGETIKEISFREPTAGDIEACGLPVRFTWLSDEGGGIKVDIESKAMTQMMSRLAAVPPLTIRSMSTRDWVSCSFALQGFFLPG